MSTATPPGSPTDPRTPPPYPESTGSNTIRRDIDRTRAEMDGTLDELGERLRPSNLIDDVADTVKGWFGVSSPATATRAVGTRTVVKVDPDTGRTVEVEEPLVDTGDLADTARRIGSTVVDVVREHPIPTLLAGAGIAYALLEDPAKKAARKARGEYQRMTYHESPEPRTYSGSLVDARTGRPYTADYGAGYRRGPGGEGVPTGGVSSPGGSSPGGPSAADRARGIASTAGAKASAAGSAVGDAASSAASSVRGAASATGDALGDAATTTGRALGDAGSAVGTAASRTAAAAGDAADAAGSGIAGAAHTVADAAETAWDATTGAVAGAWNTVAHWGSDAADATGFYARRAGETAEDYYHRTGRTLDQYGHAAWEGTRRGYAVSRERFVDAVDSNPLAVGLGFLAAGVLAGFAIPRTRKENELFGPSRDRIVNEAAEAGGQVWEQTKHAAAETADKVVKEGEHVWDDAKQALAQSADKALKNLEQQGLAPADLIEKGAAAIKSGSAAVQKAAEESGLTPQQLVDRAKHVASDVASKAEREAKQVADTAKSEAKDVAGTAKSEGEKTRDRVESEAERKKEQAKAKTGLK